MTTPLSAANTAVIILNYKNAEDTIVCLHSLLALEQRPYQIIIVDNASPNASFTTIASAIEQAVSSYCIIPHNADQTRNTEEHPTVVLIASPENNGYAAGNNIGLRFALQDQNCHAFWVLNNDTKLHPHALEALCERLNQHPNAGMAGSTLVYLHIPDTVQYAAGSTFCKWTGRTPAICGNIPLSDIANYPAANVEKQLECLCGASMLIRRKVLNIVGLLPEEYFLYYEDTAYSLSVRQAGYQLAWAPDSIVWHKEGGSGEATTSLTTKLLKNQKGADFLSLRNRVYLIRKFYLWALPVTIAGYTGVILNRILRKQYDRIPLVFKALWHGLTGRMGKPDMNSFIEKSESTLLVR